MSKIIRDPQHTVLKFHKSKMTVICVIMKTLYPLLPPQCLCVNSTWCVQVHDLPWSHCDLLVYLNGFRAGYLFVKSANVSFLLELKPDIIKDVNFALMPHSQLLKIPMKRTFSFRSFLYLLISIYLSIYLSILYYIYCIIYIYI